VERTEDGENISPNEEVKDEIETEGRKKRRLLFMINIKHEWRWWYLALQKEEREKDEEKIYLNKDRN
jgi:hypothetical protein